MALKPMVIVIGEINSRGKAIAKYFMPFRNIDLDVSSLKVVCLLLTLSEFFIDH